MSDKRIDMWKLLYSLVNRNQANLSAVYNVVDDILCQDPSLISCSTVRDDKLQDNFLLWLLNKLATWLSDCTDEGQRRQSVELQQKLLASCWYNHSKLFDRLVCAYVDALQKISAELSKEETHVLSLEIFSGEVNVLQAFDEQCAYQLINLQLEQADAFAVCLLQVLEHAADIGRATHAELFVNSLEQALLTLRECDMDTKLCCLNYCHSVLAAQSQSMESNASHFAKLSLHALTMMWSMSARWLQYQCMTQVQLQELADISEQLLNVYQSSEQWIENNCQELTELLMDLVQLPAMHKLNQKSMEIWRLLAQLTYQQPALRQDFLTNLLAILSSDKTTLEQQLCALRALKLHEQLLLEQKQQQVWHSSQNVKQLPLQLELQIPQTTPRCQWEQSVETASLLLQVHCLRQQMKPYTHQQLLQTLSQNQEEQQQKLLALNALCSLRLETPSSTHTQLQNYFRHQHVPLLQTKNVQLRELFCRQLPQLYAAGYLKATQFMDALKLQQLPQAALLCFLRLLLCAQDAAPVFLVKSEPQLCCKKCHPMTTTTELPGLYLGSCKSPKQTLSAVDYPQLAEILLFGSDAADLQWTWQHLDCIHITPVQCMDLLENCSSFGTLNARCLETLLPQLSAQAEEFMLQLSSFVLRRIVDLLEQPLATQSENDQRQYLRLIVTCAHPGISELWLFHWFNMCFFFLAHTHSLVAQEAVLAATQLCARHGLQTLTLWNWYKRDALALVVQLALHAYLNKGLTLIFYSLLQLTKMLGFSCVQEFTCKYHRLLTTLILPHCIKEPRCKGVFVLIAKQLHKPVAALFEMSFLRLYTHVYLTETTELANRCVELVSSCTKSTLQQLMNADVKQTVAELLIYFNRNPTFVMRSFQNLLQLNLDSADLSSQAANAQFSSFIAERILGVITYFESCLSEPSFEKPLKEETLYSLGQILRYVGTQHVTQFRFKIIAMLSFVHTLQEPSLQRICLKIWHIFLHFVNIEELGPSLGRIVATLQPLLDGNVEQVNELYEFLILSNASMVGSYIQGSDSNNNYYSNNNNNFYNNNYRYNNYYNNNSYNNNYYNNNYYNNNYYNNNYYFNNNYYYNNNQYNNNNYRYNNNNYYYFNNSYKHYNNNNIYYNNIYYNNNNQFNKNYYNNNYYKHNYYKHNYYNTTTTTQLQQHNYNNNSYNNNNYHYNNNNNNYYYYYNNNQYNKNYYNNNYYYLLLLYSCKDIRPLNLYFLERMEKVSPAIRQCIKRHTSQLCLTASPGEVEPKLVEQLSFLHKQLCNECLQVRIYGLEQLGELFTRRRRELNELLLQKLPMEPLLEQLVIVLISGCQHDDRQMQLAAAKCLGELGAIDASYLPSNYNNEGMATLPLSVLSDDFTVLALKALCRGYQCQQRTKHVDSFALAIQETLAVCGIAPHEQKKLSVWESLPLRMRELMEPLLHSCYTSSQRSNCLDQQPLFGSHYAQQSYVQWAFLWASRLVDYVQSTETRHLLSSYKPCIKRDSNMLSTFYPYILLHALLECSAAQLEHIVGEFQAVLQANEELSVGRNQDTAASSSALEPYKLFESRKYGAKSAQSSPETAVHSMEDQARLAGKLCAELLDFLQRWLREWQRLHGLSTGGRPPQDVDANYGAIYGFLQRLDKLQVARASYNCGEYARALRYLEDYVGQGDKQQRLLEQFSFLVELYGRLMDADSVEGAVQARSYDMSVTQQILVNRLVERQQDMITCYDQLLSSEEQLQPEHIRAIINAYLRMDTPKTALLIADGLAQRLADEYTAEYFSECKAELLWRLGSYDELEQLQQQQQTRAKPNWHAQCAQACLALRQVDCSRLEFASLLDNMRVGVLEQLRSCSALQQHSYAHAYDEVLKLHMLHELQCAQQLLEQLQQPAAAEESQQQQLMQQYFAAWQARLQLLQPQVRVLEPIYSFRRNVLAELKRRLAGDSTLQSQIQTELAQLWLNSAQINRNAGQLQRAQLYLMKAAEYAPSGLFLERAKLLWQKGDQVHAMNYLEEQLVTLEQQCAGNTKQLAGEQRQLYFEGKYLQATYNADSMNLCADAILKYFQQALAVQRQSERCHVQLAQFLEKMRDAQSSERGQHEELLLQIMLNYAKSMRYGQTHVYQSMPRLISLWLDTAASANVNPELLRKLNDLLTNCCTALPTAMFYTAYSQMLSRLCHPSPEVFAVLRCIIIKLIGDYPQQSLWMLLPHFKSATVQRIKRAKLILTDERLQGDSFQRLLQDFNTLTERLMGVTNKEVTLDRSYKLSDLDKRLPQLCQQSNFSKILLPFEQYMQPSFGLSATQAQEQQQLPASHWFPYQPLYIAGFQDKLLVLRSAARPKKLTLRCSDGKDYDIMVKPKDDLRKDARLMEFNGLMKRYLHQDAGARQRRLHIRTYAVLPFNEECGLLEWLPNLNSYRSIVMSFYMQRGQALGGRQLQQLAVPHCEPAERKREVFLKQLLPAHPPVFQDWLRQRFTTPHSWYEARNSYIRTIAVMSMVGYILGLGDRHGENILFDERNGDAVHVDFNCLFNQGENFAYPEVVPFRLTDNMITAMGPLGVEGSFRKCCEITLRLLRHESKTLMSMLRPFVYDLGIQNRLTANASSNRRPGAELTDPKATNDVQRIAERLQGHVKRQQSNSIPLSTEGQVNFLINEATKVDNLAAMYVGWGAFL
ncbi:mei-41 [Drosophila busckii]|uniref:Serine/threonine-protein kinase ATR n=1 Tax=Drosophila busckii TaxID=30019 RepID=A0A0M4EFR1_DROBS|nr:mei-41 [Drosophila busckii]